MNAEWYYYRKLIDTFNKRYKIRDTTVLILSNNYYYYRPIITQNLGCLHTVFLSIKHEIHINIKYANVKTT